MSLPTYAPVVTQLTGEFAPTVMAFEIANRDEIIGAMPLGPLEADGLALIWPEVVSMTPTSMNLTTAILLDHFGSMTIDQVAEIVAQQKAYKQAQRDLDKGTK